MPFAGRNNFSRVPFRVPSFVASLVEPGWLNVSLSALEQIEGKYTKRASKFDSKSINNYYRVKMGFESNALEGNTFTESEVATLVQGCQSIPVYHDNPYCIDYLLIQELPLVVNRCRIYWTYTNTMSLFSNLCLQFNTVAHLCLNFLSKTFTSRVSRLNWYSYLQTI